jgi:hypothetical protein
MVTDLDGKSLLKEIRRQSKEVDAQMSALLREMERADPSKTASLKQRFLDLTRRRLEIGEKVLRCLSH